MRPAKRLEEGLRYSVQGLSPEHLALANEARDYVLALSEDFPTLVGTAKELGVSSSHLSRVFNSVFGYTFTAFVKDIKVREIHDIFANDIHISVKETAYATGFKNPDYFSTWFKDATGLPPTTYKRRLHMPNKNSKK